MALTKADLPTILRNHYKECDLSVPDISRRSVAFSTWDRHNAYQSIEDLREDIVENVPNTMFYSTARYLNPSANAGVGNASETWKRKDRKSTDLTFDLDFDHVEGHDNLEYADQIKVIAEHTLRLVNILETQYGVPQDKYEITFSGRRGFHVRVFDERYVHLTKYQRQQIMRHLLGEGLDRKATLASYHMNPRSGDLGFKLHKPSMKSWGGRIRLACNWLMDNFDQATLEQWWPKKITPKELQNLMSRFVNSTFRARLTKTGDLRAFLGQKLATKARLENMYKMLETLAISMYSVEIDTSVTAELNKIIRMKGSINTKQGYECRAVEKDELTDMDYLFYNCRQTFGEKPVEIQVPKHMVVHGERTFKLEAGVHTLPMHEAVLALCQMDQ